MPNANDFRLLECHAAASYLLRYLIKGDAQQSVWQRLETELGKLRAALRGHIGQVLTSELLAQEFEKIAISFADWLTGEFFTDCANGTTNKTIQSGLYQLVRNKVRDWSYFVGPCIDPAEILGESDIYRILDWHTIDAEGKSLLTEARQFTDHMATLTKNLGTLTYMASVGIYEYEIVVVRDERTSTICRYMDGRRYVVRKVLDHYEQALGRLNAKTETDSALTKLHPFPPRTSETLSTAELARYAKIPPFHLHCRSEIMEVSVRYETVTEKMYSGLRNYDPKIGNTLSGHERDILCSETTRALMRAKWDTHPISVRNKSMANIIARHLDAETYTAGFIASDLYHIIKHYDELAALYMALYGKLPSALVPADLKSLSDGLIIAGTLTAIRAVKYEGGYTVGNSLWIDVVLDGKTYRIYYDLDRGKIATLFQLVRDTSQGLIMELLLWQSK